MSFAVSVTAIATASYCVTNGAHMNRAHATDTHDEVSDPHVERIKSAFIHAARIG